MPPEKSYLEVNLSSLLFNLNSIRSFLSDNTSIIAVVKANAYGLGSIAVTKALVKSGINFFAVALVKEAIALRKAGIKEKILLLSPFTDDEIPAIIENKLIPSVISFERASMLNTIALKYSTKLKVHLKIDTGMGRLGTRINEAPLFINKASVLENLSVEGIYSHFASADIPDIEFTKYQIKRFSALIKPSHNLIYHLANSSGIVAFRASHLNAVRPGLILYGAYPSDFIKSKVTLKKVVKLKSRVVSIKEIESGDSVSYSRTFIAKKKTKVAIIPIGYADGYSTLLSNKGLVMIKGKKAAVIGRVCMDYTTIDVSNIDNVALGDEVTLIGDGITEEEIAEKTKLIPYEILTSITSRIQRVYV